MASPIPLTFVAMNCKTCPTYYTFNIFPKNETAEHDMQNIN